MVIINLFIGLAGALGYAVLDGFRRERRVVALFAVPHAEPCYYK